MLKLRDFLHLPQVDALVKQLVDDQPGLMLLAGIDTRRATLPPGDSIKSSGLSALFNILMQELLLTHPEDQAVVIAEERALAKVPRQIGRRVRFIRAEPPFSYHGQIELAIIDRPGLLVIDHLNEESAAPAFHAAQSGLRVLTQIGSVLRGPAVARQLVEMGVAQEQLSALRWIVTNQRMSALCERCRQAVPMPEDVLEQYRARYPHLREVADSLAGETSQPAANPAAQPAFYTAGGCEHCRGTGYSGEITIFDFFRGGPETRSFFTQNSLLSMEEYALRMAAQGLLDLNDVLNLESDHLRKAYQMFTASEHALAEANSKLSRKILEVEASNRVLVQRTDALMSLQGLGQALITSSDLNDLAGKICRRASELCGADRVVLYLRRQREAQGDVAEILAERGWGAARIGHLVEAKLVFGQPSPSLSMVRAGRYMQVPPGMESDAPGIAGETNEIKMGIRVPLIALDLLVGVMIVQSTQKEFFNQGESALLQTFANQAALAIQRAGLVDELRAKITQLEEAQTELVKKERMERELELARQVQQSMLPQHFPEVRGFDLAAKNEPARQVGGDFYDLILLDEDHFGVVMADVADKGLPAALYMALTRSLLLAEARRTLSPRLTLENVNRLLLELGDLNGFVSIFYGVVDIPSRRLVYTRAGHERPMLLRSGQVSALDGHGAVLGILQGAELNLTEESIDLARDDRLVLYTDGITDVLNAAGNFSGIHQFTRILQSNAGKNADGICQAVFDYLQGYRGSAEQFDDMTLLVLHLL